MVRIVFDELFPLLTGIPARQHLVVVNVRVLSQDR